MKSNNLHDNHDPCVIILLILCIFSRSNRDPLYSHSDYFTSSSTRFFSLISQLNNQNGEWMGQHPSRSHTSQSVASRTRKRVCTWSRQRLEHFISWQQFISRVHQSSWCSCSGESQFQEQWSQQQQSNHTQDQQSSVQPGDRSLG